MIDTQARMALNPKMPPDFPAVFMKQGWRAIENLFGARTAINKRWVAALGDAASLPERMKARRTNDRG